MSGFTFPSSSSSSSSFGIGSTASTFGSLTGFSFGSSVANPISTSSSDCPFSLNTASSSPKMAPSFGFGPASSSSSYSSPFSLGSFASTGASSGSSFFGAASSSGSSLFGAATPASRSASRRTAASSSSTLFGSCVPVLFGANSAPVFGAPSLAASSSSTLFGTPSSAASSGSTLFGTTSSAASSGSTLFGTPSSAASSGSSIFGVSSTKATSTPSLFGASSAPSTSTACSIPAFGASSSSSTTSSTTSSPSFQNIASSSSSLNTCSALTLSAAASGFYSAESTPSSTSTAVSAAAPSLTLSSSSSSGFSLGIPASSSTKSSSGFGNDGSSASAAKPGTGVPAFGVSSSSATTASSVDAPASAAAASGDVSSSTDFGLSTESLPVFQPSTKTSAAAPSSSQVQSTSASPVFDAEVKRSYKRDLPPAHFMFKIESFSLLSEAEVEKYETDVFEVGGYKWSLIFYPNGDKNADIDDHISLYLAIKETEKLPACWEVNATFKFFVLDHIRDKYLTVEGCKGSMKRFHALKTEWGFAQFLSLESVKNASTGYLVGDSCIFGAEVFVVKSSCKVECLSMIKYTFNNLMTWKIEDFSKLDEESYESEVFDVGGSKWKLRLYPKGERLAKVKSLSLYLCRNRNETVSLAPSHKLFAHYKLRIRNQIQDSDHVERIGKRWFDSSSLSWGYMDYISLQDLKNPVKGLLVKDCLIVEAEILYVSKVKSLS